MTETIIEYSIRIYTVLLPLAWIGLALVLIICVPLSCFIRTRSFAGQGFYYFSYLLGATTWFLGCAISFATWGWTGIIIGLLLGGVGVVPIAILAAFISVGDWTMGVSLIVMVLMVFGARFAGVALVSNAEQSAV